MKIQSATIGGAYIERAASSTTNPALSFRGDEDTGVGSSAGNTDLLSLIAGGVEGVRITESASDITVDVSGDLQVTGDQTYYGEMYVSSSGATSYTSGWEDAPATWSSDDLNGVTFSDTELTCTNAGKYMVTASVSCSASDRDWETYISP